MSPVIFMQTTSLSILKKAAPALALATTALLTASVVFGQAPQAPTLKIITPGEDQTIYGAKIPVLLAVENLTLTDYQTTKTAVAGQGHVHLWLDEASPTRESAVKLTTDEFTFSDVPYGDHTLSTELVNNDHTSLRPPVVATVKFKSAAVSSPSPIASSGFDKNTAIVILVVVALVILAAWWYTKEEDEEKPEESKVTKGSKGSKVKKTVKKAKKSRRSK